MTVRTSKSEKQREKRMEKKKTQTECPRTVGQLQKVYHAHDGSTSRRRKTGTKAVIETVMTQNFPTLTSHSKPRVPEAWRALLVRTTGAPSGL